MNLDVLAISSNVLFYQIPEELATSQTFGWARHNDYLLMGIEALTALVFALYYVWSLGYRMYKGQVHRLVLIVFIKQEYSDGLIFRLLKHFIANLALMSLHAVVKLYAEDQMRLKFVNTATLLIILRIQQFPIGLLLVRTRVALIRFIRHTVLFNDFRIRADHSMFLISALLPILRISHSLRRCHFFIAWKLSL